jgi:PKD repeat protein
MTLVSSCDKDDEEDTPPAAPLATFQFEVSDENPLEVAFTNYSTNASSYSWDFGDGNTSTETSPTYTYEDGGTYTVKLTATGAGGSADHSKDVTVVKPGGENLIQNGGFDDESVWAIKQYNPNNTGTLTIADGVATFNKGIVGEWGTEPHVGIDQMVTVVDGSYMFDLHIITNGINEVWFEVWVGPNAPVDGEDYNDTNGATRVLSFNAWACGDINNTYNGQMAAADCEGTGGLIDLVAGDYYVVIRSGGITNTDDGIVIDEVTMVQL